jgi:hypothetical protein
VPYAKNALDASGIYFEDDGGTGTPVVLHGGFLDSVATVRDLDLAQALRDEFRLIYVDHRGVGRSNKPHEPDAYAMPLRVADAVAVLDELGIESARLGNGMRRRPQQTLYEAMEACISGTTLLFSASKRELQLRGATTSSTDLLCCPELCYCRLLEGACSPCTGDCHRSCCP